MIIFMLFIIYLQESSMTDFDHQSNLSAYYNTFKVSLTR